MLTVFQLIKILETKDPNAAVVFVDELHGKVTEFDLVYSSIRENKESDYRLRSLEFIGRR